MKVNSLNAFLLLSGYAKSKTRLSVVADHGTSNYGSYSEAINVRRGTGNSNFVAVRSGKQAKLQTQTKDHCP